MAFGRRIVRRYSGAAEANTAAMLIESFKREIEPSVATFREFYHRARVITATSNACVSLSVEVTLLRWEKREDLERAIKYAISKVLKNVCNS